MFDQDFTLLSGNRDRNWFYKKYWYDGKNPRYHTFHLALNLLSHRSDYPTIVETGCQRQEEDIGAGMSTSVFANYCSRYGGHVFSVDISQASVSEAALAIDKQNLSSYVTLTCDNSLNYLPSVGFCNLLYLDSFDYPYGDLLDKYGGKEDIHYAERTLWIKHPDVLVEEFKDVILPCQEHCLKEFQSVEKSLNPKVILMIDDCQLPGGGKGRLLHEYLVKNNQWICLLDAYQSVWVRKETI